VVFYTPLK